MAAASWTFNGETSGLATAAVALAGRLTHAPAPLASVAVQTLPGAGEPPEIRTAVKSKVESGSVGRTAPLKSRLLKYVTLVVALANTRLVNAGWTRLPETSAPTIAAR